MNARFTDKRRTWTLAAVVLLGGSGLVAPRSDPVFSHDEPQGPAGQTSPDEMLASLRAKVVEAHNQIRAEHHLPALEISGRLEAAAQSHAGDMAARRKMSHE